MGSALELFISNVFGHCLAEMRARMNPHTHIHTGDKQEEH